MEQLKMMYAPLTLKPDLDCMEWESLGETHVFQDGRVIYQGKLADYWPTVLGLKGTST